MFKVLPVRKKKLVATRSQEEVLTDMIAIRWDGSNDPFDMRINISGEKPNASVYSLMLSESDDCDLISAEVRWPLSRRAGDHLRF